MYHIQKFVRLFISFELLLVSIAILDLMQIEDTILKLYNIIPKCEKLKLVGLYTNNDNSNIQPRFR